MNKEMIKDTLDILKECRKDAVIGVIYAEDQLDYAKSEVEKLDRDIEEMEKKLRQLEGK